MYLFFENSNRVYLLNAHTGTVSKTRQRVYNFHMSRCNLMYIRYIEQRCRRVKARANHNAAASATNVTAGIWQIEEGRRDDSYT